MSDLFNKEYNTIQYNMEISRGTLKPNRKTAISQDIAWLYEIINSISN